MVDTTLKAYIAELKLLLEQEALEEVMGHCRHILQHFPKNVETYRILGRALIEKNRHQEAGDVFQRVLSALPDDFVSHLGLSGVAEEAGQLPLAIFHLERAFEQEPNNAALRDEIKRLYEKRDGVAPERLQVTLGGLVHSYVKGRLYEQAIGELTKALAASPDRADWQLLLTEVLWESDRPVEAADSALQVLERLPDSIEANRIMTLLWLKASRPSDAAPFLSRLEQLDPFLAWGLVNPGKELRADAFALPRLDWDARAAAAMATDVPDWVNSISNVFEAPDSVSLGGSNDWTADAQSPTRRPQSGLLRARGNTDQLNKADPFSAATGSTSQSNESVEIPDWFNDVTETPASTSTDADDVPDWFKDASPAEPAQAAAVVPSWMDDMPDVSDIAGDQLPSGFTDLLAGSQSQPPAPAAPQSGALDASWLNTGPLPSLDEPASTPISAEAEAPELDWMMDLPAEPEAPQSGAMDAMSWLNTGPLPSLDEPAPVSSDVVDEEPTFDWVDSAATSESSVESAEPEASNAMDAMSWLNTGPLPSLDEPAPVSGNVVDEEPTFDWVDSATASESSVESAEPEASGALDAMSWLNTGSLPSLDDILPASETAEIPVVNDQPTFEWLNDSADAPDAGADVSEPVSAEASQDEPMFAWLNNTTADEPQGATEDAGNFEAPDADAALDWMSGTPEPQPEATSDQPDPMAWFQNYAGSSESSEQEPEAATGESFNWNDSEVPLAEAGDAPDWLSRFAPTDAGQPGGSEESIGAPDYSSQNFSSSAPSEPSVELEDDWLASFETGSLSSSTLNASAEPAQLSADDWFGAAETNQPVASTSDQNEWTMLENPGITASDNWLGATDEEQPAVSSEAPEESAWMTSETAPSSEEDWMSSLDLNQGSAEPATPADNDWLGSMQSTASSSVADSSDAPDGDWLAALGSADAAPAGGSDWLSPEANDDFENLLKGAAEQANQPRVVGESGQLDISNLPDWMNAFPEGASAEPAKVDEPDLSASSSLGGFDFSNLTDTTEEAEPTGEAPDWLSAMGMSSESASDSSDWLSSMAAPAESSAPATSFDDLDFGDLGSTPAEPAGEAPDWLSSMAAPAEASAPATSFDDFNFDDLDSASAEPAGEAPDWLSSMAPVGESSALATSLDDLDFGDLGSAAAEPAGEAPDWLSSMAPVGESSAPAASLDDLDFGDLGSAPAEPAGEAPDWLSSMPPVGGSSAPASSLDDLDFGDLGSAAAEPAGEAPDWLSSMAPVGEASAPATSFDDLDFGDLGSASAEPAQAAVADTSFDDLGTAPTETVNLPAVEDGPDWLSAFASEPEPEPEPLAETQPNARHAMPEHFPEVDLSKLPEEAAEDSGSSDYAFSFNRVAQPTDLVNTNADSMSFSFQRKPAWMRKGKPSKGK